MSDNNVIIYSLFSIKGVKPASLLLQISMNVPAHHAEMVLDAITESTDTDVPVIKDTLEETVKKVCY